MAEEAISEARHREQRPEDTFLNPPATKIHSGKTLVEAIIYREVNSIATITSELLPGDVPLLDKLLVKSRGNVPYQLPTTATLSDTVMRRQFNKRLVDEQEVIVIRLGEETVDSIRAKFDTVERYMEQDEKKWPTSTVSLRAEPQLKKKRSKTPAQDSLRLRTPPANVTPGKGVTASSTGERTNTIPSTSQQADTPLQDELPNSPVFDLEFPSPPLLTMTRIKKILQNPLYSPGGSGNESDDDRHDPADLLEDVADKQDPDISMEERPESDENNN